MAKINTDEGKRIVDLEVIDSISQEALLLITLSNGSCRNITMKSFRASLFSQGTEPDPDHEIYSKSDIDDKIHAIEQNAQTAVSDVTEIKNTVNETIQDLNDKFNEYESSTNIAVDNKVNEYKTYLDGQVNNINISVTNKLNQFDEVADQFAKKSITKNITIPSTGWNGDDTPYDCSLTVDGVTETNNIEIFISNTATKEQLEAWWDLGLGYGTQSANTINLKAFGYKPQVDIPVTVIIRAD